MILINSMFGDAKIVQKFSKAKYNYIICNFKRFFNHSFFDRLKDYSGREQYLAVTKGEVVVPVAARQTYLHSVDLEVGV